MRARRAYRLRYILLIIVTSQEEKKESADFRLDERKSTHNANCFRKNAFGLGMIKGYYTDLKFVPVILCLTGSVVRVSNVYSVSGVSFHLIHPPASHSYYSWRTSSTLDHGKINGSIPLLGT